MVLPKESQPIISTNIKPERQSLLQQRSSGSVSIISIHRTELLEALRSIATQLCANHAEVKSVRLFGSLARGDQVGASDIDILIVLRGCGQEDRLLLARRYYPYFDLPIGVDLLVISEEQIGRQLAEGRPWIRQVWQESLPLEQREG
jgi:UTP:GlnB (protein PII) uridylyltransferase